jgi:hypothetical protein
LSTKKSKAPGYANLSREGKISIVRRLKDLEKAKRAAIFQMKLEDKRNPFPVSGKSAQRYYNACALVNFVYDKANLNGMGAVRIVEVSAIQALFDEGVQMKKKKKGDIANSVFEAAVLKAANEKIAAQDLNTEVNGLTEIKPTTMRRAKALFVAIPSGNVQ